MSLDSNFEEIGPFLRSLVDCQIFVRSTSFIKRTNGHTQIYILFAYANARALTHAHASISELIYLPSQYFLYVKNETVEAIKGTVEMLLNC